MNSIKRTLVYGLIGLCSYIGLDLKASDQKLDFGEIYGEVIGRSLIDHDKYGLLCLLHLRDSDGVTSYHILGGDPEYIREFVGDAGIGKTVYAEFKGSRTIDFCGLEASVTDVDSVTISSR